MKIPCIVPRVGGIPEIVKDGYNGIIYDDYSPDSILLCVDKIKKDYEKYSKNCIQDVFNYSFEKLYQQWEKIIK